jgi:tripartite-type tricarboxylate transporter receptor subunit TctC
MLHIPYKGSSGARTDVLGGQVDMMFDAVPTMAEFIRSGKATALATTGKTRSEVLPNVPTMNEAGVPGYEAVIWLGLMAPKGTPPAIVARLNEEVGKFASDPQTVQAWAKQGTTPMKMTPAAFSKYVQDDITKWAKVVKVSGAKADR